MRYNIVLHYTIQNMLRLRGTSKKTRKKRLTFLALHQNARGRKTFFQNPLKT